MGFRQLAIRVLGSLELLHDGRPVELPASKKTRAILGYLVATGRTHTRERLCDLLWDSPDDPRAALRWTLWKLRPLLDDGATSRLVATRDSVAFEAHGAAIDLAVVRRVLASGVEATTTDALENAAAAFRGEFLEGLDLDNCIRWHAWYVAERESLRGAQRSILSTLVERLADRPDDALRHARARVAIDPLAEDAHFAVMQLLVALGRSADAIEQYDVWSRLCEREIGTRPSDRLRAWRAEQNLARISRPASVLETAHLPSNVLVGRDSELAALRAVLDRPGTVAIVEGEPGIGKTRLLEELLPLAPRAVRARIFEAERLRPYGPWIDLLGAELAVDTTNREAIWASAIERVRALGRALVIIDDFQWADEESAALLHHVVRSGIPTAFALGIRSGELADNLPCLRVLRALGRDGRLLRIPLGPLEAAHARALAASIDPTSDADAIARESEGNPFFAIELARAGSNDGIPPAIHDVIEERLERLDEPARALLAVLAVLGRNARAELLAEATGMADAELLRVLELLERRQILRVESDVWGFAHDLTSRAMLHRTSAPRRRILHGLVARVLERHDADGSLAGAVARHASLGGDSRLAATAAIRAGKHGLRLFAYSAARSYFELGRVEARRLPAEVRIPLEIELFEIVVHPALELRAPEIIGADLVTLARETAEHRLDREHARALLLLARLYYHTWIDVPRARAALDNAVRLLEKNATDNREALVSGLRCLALVHWEMPRVRAQLESIAELGESITASLYYQWGIGLVRAWEGRADDARTALRSAIDHARRRADHWAEYECASALAVLELDANDAGSAARAGAELRAIADRLGPVGSERAYADALEAIASGDEAAVNTSIRELDRLDAGALAAQIRSLAAERMLVRDVATAERLAREAVAVATRASHALEVARAEVALGRALRSRGDLDGSNAAFERAQRLGADLPAPLRARLAAR